MSLGLGTVPSAPRRRPRMVRLHVLRDNAVAVAACLLLTRMAWWLISDASRAFYLSAWATSGLVVFLLLRRGKALLPGLLLGEFLSGLMLGVVPREAVLLSIGVVLSAWFSVRMMRRLYPAWEGIEQVGDLFAFIALPCVVNALLVGFWSVLVQRPDAMLSWPGLLSAMSNGLSVVFGVVIFSTNLLLWPKSWRWRDQIPVDPVFWLFALASTTVVTAIFWLSYPAFSGDIELTGLLLLPAFWSMTRFPLSDVYRLVLLQFLIAIAGTARGLGPYAGAIHIDPESLLQLVGVGMVMVGLFAGAMITESVKGRDVLRQGNRWLERQVQERTTALRQSHREVLARERFFQALSEVNRLFSGSVEEPEAFVLEAFCRTLQAQLKLPLVWVVETSPESDWATLRAVAGPLAEVFRGVPIPVHEDRAPSGVPLPTDRAIPVSPAVDRDKAAWAAWRAFAARYALGGSVQVAFSWPDGRSGRIALQRDRGAEFPRQTMQLMAGLSGDLQDFLRRQEAGRTLERTRTLQRALLLAGEVALTTEEVGVLFQRSCQQLIDSGLFIAAWIARPGADGCMDALASAGWSASNALKRRWPVSADVPEGQTVGARAWRSGDLVVQQDYLSDPLVQLWREQALEYGWRAAAAVPIVHQGEQWAILAVIGGQPMMFSEEICELLRQISRLIGHGMDELFLKKSLAEEKESLAQLSAQDATMRRYQAAVVQLQRYLLDRRGSAAIFPVILQILVEETEATAAYIVLPDPVAPILRETYLKAATPEIAHALLELADTQNVLGWPSEQTLLGEILHRDRSCEGPLVRDTLPPYHPIFDAYPGLQDQLAAKMLWPIFTHEGGHPEAILGIMSARAGHFTTAVQQLYSQVANSIGLALRQERYQQEIEQAQEKLQQVAFYDPLTGLPNRRLLEAQLEQAMARHQRQGGFLAICMLDLDDFKPINDRFGHEAGDEVLAALGQRLPEVLRCNDMVGRFGGDEFVILLESVQNQEDLYQILYKIESVITSPLMLQNGTNVRVGVSMGVSIFPGAKTTATPDGLLRDADQALYESKRSKADRSAYWVLHETAAAMSRSPLAQRLLANGRLHVLYQPVWDNQAMAVVGMEALARLRADNGRMLAPREFLPQLRGADLCHLTQHMLVQALEDLKILDGPGRELWVSVNIDPQSLNKSCIRQIRQIILQSGVNPARIMLEILEGSDFLERNAALELLQQLKALGVRLALDDVGSAYASLLRLKDLPVDEIKLDQGFVRMLAQRPEDLHFVLAVRDLAQGLGVDLVVEGVENEAVLDAMITLDIPLLQGRGIARPMPVARLQRWLQKRYVQHPHPSTLLGVYAAQMANHSVLSKMVRQNPHLLDSMTLGNAQTCPIHGHLRRLGRAEGNALDQWHHAYHQAMGTLVEQLDRDSGRADWTVLEETETAFLQSLRDAWQGHLR